MLIKSKIVCVLFLTMIAFRITWTKNLINQEPYGLPNDDNSVRQEKISKHQATLNFTHQKLQDDTINLNSAELNTQKSEIAEDDILETVTTSVVTSVTTSATQIPHHAHQEKESQEEEEEEESEEENTDIVQSLISSFLGGLSTPEGGVDVDAIVGLIGGLSVPNDDGTYDFSGLTETLQSVLGPNADGGGSDFGAFVGGLLGAVIQGVAIPPGAKGSGKLAGRLLAAVLPGLSMPVPPPEQSNGKEEQGLDSASFFHGFIKGSSAGNMTGNSNGNVLSNVKQTVFKTAFSFISSFFTKPTKNNWS